MRSFHRFSILKHVAVILLLLLVLSVQTPFGQLLKLPLLVEHFIKHRHQNGLSVIAFLQQHYASDHRDADWPEDAKLPFKNITFNTVVYTVNPSVIQSNQFISFHHKEKILIPENYASQQYPGSIFHPPQ